jgi:hypothetical protein
MDLNAYQKIEGRERTAIHEVLRRILGLGRWKEGNAGS